MRRTLIGLWVLGLVLAGCGGGETGTDITANPTATATQAAAQAQDVICNAQADITAITQDLRSGTAESTAEAATRIDDLQARLQSEAAGMDADAAQQVQLVANGLGQLAEAVRGTDPQLVANAAQTVDDAVAQLCSP
jgi:hypothetical protein